MSRRKLVVLGGAAVLVVSGWYAFRPERLFVDQVVAEDFPVAMSSTDMPTMDEMTAPPMSVAEPMPAGTTRVLADGMFRSIAHKTTGKAAIHELDDGTRVLRLTEFATSNGPDVRIYLVAAEDAPDHDAVKKAGFIELGALKGNIGNQNYDIPASVDLTKYRAVTIWCKRFSVNFGTAPLKPAES